MVQSHIFPASDALLRVAAGKTLLVKVNVTQPNAAEPVPEGALQLLDAKGALVETLPLIKPKSLPAALPAKPDFSVAYTATVPAPKVTVGMRLVASLTGAAGSFTASPTVLDAPAVSIVGVRVKHSDSRDATALPTSFASQLLDRYPVKAVNYSVRAAGIDLGKPNAETANPDKRDVFVEAMNAVGEARVADGVSAADTFYYGFVYWAAYGGVGVGVVGGHAAAGWDRHGDPLLTEGVRDTWIHETGHNFGLGHAPSENEPASRDYPYAGGLMGDASRATWTYLMSEGPAQTLRDPLKTRDVMSYSGPSYGRFSDANYMLAFDRLRTNILKAKSAAAPAAEQEMLLLSGTVSADGQVSWRPGRRYQGVYHAAEAAGASLRVTSLDGSVRSYPVALLALSDQSGRRAFMLGVPYASTAARVELLDAGGRTLGVQTTQATARSQATAASTSGPNVSATERGGKLAVTWNAAAYPYLTVSHVLNGARTTFAVNQVGGHTELSTRELAAGGSFEFALSDGLNGERVAVPR